MKASEKYKTDIPFSFKGTGSRSMNDTFEKLPRKKKKKRGTSGVLFPAKRMRRKGLMKEER